MCKALSLSYEDHTQSLEEGPSDKQDYLTYLF